MSEIPSRLEAAHTAWEDLVVAARSHAHLAVLAAAACTATSVANTYLNPADDVSAGAIARGLALALGEAFLITPVLLAAHRFIILGETTKGYVRALSTRRFWRFFALTAVITSMVFVAVLVVHLRHADEDTSLLALVASIVAFVAASTLLSLLFPAIAVDAPGIGIRNAVADLWGNVWRIFWVGVIAMLPLVILTAVIAIAHSMILGDTFAARIAFAPVEGMLIATTYVVLVLIASRFYLQLAERLKRSD